jgi:hypothetical protein
MLSEKSITRRQMELHQADENRADGTLADLAMGPALVAKFVQFVSSSLCPGQEKYTIKKREV